MKTTIEKLLNNHTLSETEAKDLVLQMLRGEVTDEQIASILTIFRFRGETVEEIVGFAKGMKESSLQIKPTYSVLDTCGTGGDGIGTYNISTAVAILLSSMGIPVAKHGNRSVSSMTGSADVLEYLEIPIQSNKEDALRSLEENNLCFLFTPIFANSFPFFTIEAFVLPTSVIIQLLFSANVLHCSKIDRALWTGVAKIIKSASIAACSNSSTALSIN